MMNLLINIPDEFQEAFDNDHLRYMLDEAIYNLYKCTGVNVNTIQLLKVLKFIFDKAIPVNTEYHTEMTKYGGITEMYVSWDAEAEDRLNKESMIKDLYDLKVQNKKLKELLSKMIYVLSDPATTNLDKIKSCFGYDLDELLGEYWRDVKNERQ